MVYIYSTLCSADLGNACNITPHTLKHNQMKKFTLIFKRKHHVDPCVSWGGLSHFTVQMKLYIVPSQHAYRSRKATDLTAAGPVKLNMAFEMELIWLLHITSSKEIHVRCKNYN